MVAVVSTNPNERLLDNRFENDVENNEEPVTLRQRLFTKKRTVIFASVLSLFIVVLASTLTGIFVARYRAVVAFRTNLTQHLDEKFGLLEPRQRLVYVTELTDLFKNGHISNDYVAEFGVLMEFNEFNKVYSRKHADAEERRTRLLAFRERYNAVKAQTGEELYEKGINQFSDMTKEEFEQRFPQISVDELKKKVVRTGPARVSDPDHLEKLRVAKGLGVGERVTTDGEGVDWRRCNGVTPVKDQGSCGSCWAFAAVGAVESLYLLKKGETLDLSEQELVNCEPFSRGCEGGVCDKALEYIETNGLSHERDLPYSAVNEKCAVPLSNKVFVDSHIPTTGLDILNNSLVVSPTTVYLAVSDELTQYKSGIYTGSCADALNHSALLVGEGYDEKSGKRYWIVKNSWGPNWGEDGYLRLERTGEETDKCGILELGCRPIFRK